MPEIYRCDVAVIGGGIAGLWVFRRLAQAGFHPILLETARLGAGQTLAAQGIIHGGAKYSMHGQISDHTRALAAMPGIWKASLEGHGDIDLRAAKVLAHEQVLWSSGGLAQNLTAFFASKLIRSGVSPLSSEQWPALLRVPEFKGRVYRLDEVIVDTRSVLAALAANFRTQILHAPAILPVRSGDHLESLHVKGPRGEFELRARCAIFTAGVGNEGFAMALGLGKRIAQRRPLKMIIARGMTTPFFGHCITTSSRPRVTITTHGHEGDLVWYMGGEIAEKAVGMEDTQAIAFARSELMDIFPWLDWTRTRLETYGIDRAEPWDEKAVLPSGPTIHSRGNCALAWPTKMVFAPALAAAALDWARSLGIEPACAPALPLEPAQLGNYPWERIEQA